MLQTLKDRAEKARNRKTLTEEERREIIRNSALYKRLMAAKEAKLNALKIEEK
jgi:hypothetical protein